MGNPVARRVQLGQTLAAARAAAGVSRDAAGAKIEYDGSKIGRIERGEGKLRPGQLRALLDLYRVDDACRDLCERLAASVDDPGWWQPYAGALSESYRRLLGFEDVAVETRAYSIIIPGLLQTRETARALMESAIPHVPNRAIEDRISARLARQARVFGPDGPIVHVILDESALLRQIGGPEVWRAQLVHLGALLARAPRRVIIQTLRFDAGASPALNSAFTAMHLREPADTWIVHTETPTGDRWVEDRDAAVYLAVFDRLMADAVDPKRTSALLETVLDTWRVDA